LVVIAALTPEQSQDLYIWLNQNNWFVLAYIGVVLIGVIVSILNWYSTKDYDLNEIREELREFELNPISYPKVPYRKTINPTSSLILGIIIAIGLPFVLFAIIFMLAVSL